MPGDDGYSKYTQQSIETRDLLRAKRIVVLKSGDRFFFKNVVINERNCPNTPRFMERMTEVGELTSCCKRVYDVAGRPIEHASLIEDGGRYIITDKKGLKRMGYESIAPKRYRYQGNHTSSGYFGGRSDFGYSDQQYLQTLNTSNPKYRDVSSRIKKVETHATVIYIYQNNDRRGDIAIVCLRPYDMRSSQSCFKAIADKIKDTFDKKFERLVKFSDSSVVTDLQDLQHKEIYVFLPPGKSYVPLPYPTFHQENFSHSPRSDFRRHPVYPRNTRPRTLPTLQHGNLVTGQNYSSPDYSVASNPEDGRNAKRPHNGYPLNKPQRHKPSPERQRKTHKTQPVDYDRNDGIFRAKGSNQETQGAKEVKDSPHTRTDLPIDQRKAEIVSDEEFDDDKKKQQNRNKNNYKNNNSKSIKNDNKSNRNDKMNEDKKNNNKNEKSNDGNNKENVKKENEKDKKPNAKETKENVKKENEKDKKPNTKETKEKDKNVKNNEKNNDKDKSKNVKGSNNEKGKTTQKDNTKIDSSRKTASPPGNQQQQKNTNNSNVRTSTPDGQTEREREEAAIKIQSQYKAFKQREKMAKEKEDESARKKQDDNDAKKREEEMKKQEAEAKKKEEEAQKEAYNRRIEQELEEMRKKEEEEEKKRQGQGQGEQQKSEKKELSKEEAAAIIQSNYKAFKVREQVREKKKEMESETENNKNENTPAISDFPGDNESVVEGTNNPPGSTAYLSRDASASTSKNAP